MKNSQFIFFLVLLGGSIASADIENQLSMSNNPYETLKAAYNQAPLIPSFNDIPWALQYKGNYSCTYYAEDLKEQHRKYVGLMKWIEKIQLTQSIPAKPGNGPLVPPTPEVPPTYSTRSVISLVFDLNPLEYSNSLFSDENALAPWQTQQYTYYESSADRALIINTHNSSNEIEYLRKTDKYIFFKSSIDGKDDYYGYCWRSH
jgi:hypothetical protein